MTAVCADAVFIRKLFKAVELNDQQMFLQIYWKIPNISRSFIWRTKKSATVGKGDTLLHVAARSDLEWVLQLALSDNADFCVVSRDGKHPLHEAAQGGSFTCCKFLLCSANVPVDPLKRSDWTPLMLTCAACARDVTNYPTNGPQYSECVDLLLAHGANPSFTNKDGWNCLHIAVRSGSNEVVRLLLRHSRSLLSTSTANGRTALHCLSTGSLQFEKLYPIATTLLESAHLRLVADTCGTLPVFDALRWGNIYLAEILLQEDTAHQLSHRDSLGQQAVHVAAESGQVESLKLIQKHLGFEAFRSPICADPPNSLCGVTALHLVCRSGHVEALSFIVSELIQVCKSKPAELTNVLCHLDCRGYSPFHHAVFGCTACGSVHLAERLSCIDHLCQTVLCSSSHPETRARLFEHLNSLLTGASGSPMENPLKHICFRLEEENLRVPRNHRLTNET